jgi:hypothetical protein
VTERYRATGPPLTAEVAHFFAAIDNLVNGYLQTNHLGRSSTSSKPSATAEMWRVCRHLHWRWQPILRRPNDWPAIWQSASRSTGSCRDADHG